MTGRRHEDARPGVALPLGAVLVLAAVAAFGAPGCVVIALGGMTGVGLALAGLNHRRLPGAALAEAWPWVLGASVVWTVGACTHELGPGIGDAALVGLALEVVALGVLAVGLVARSRHVAEGDPLPVVDAAVVMVAGGFAGFIVLTESVSAIADPYQRTVLYLGQLAAVLLMGALGYAIAVGESRRAVSTGLLSTAGLVAVVAHGLDQYDVLHPGASVLSHVLVPVGAAAVPLIVAAAAWAPDAAVDLASRRAARERTGSRQILLVAAASLLVPVLIGLELVRGGQVHLGEGVVLAIVLISLVMTRVVVLVRRLRDQADALEARVWTDSITGLANREALLSRLARMAEAGLRRGALVLLDLDRFSELRDALGVATTDALLQEIGARAAEAADGRYVARVGSGAFAVVVPDAADRERAHAAARTLLESVERPLALDEISLQVGAAAGVVLLDDDSTAEQLLQRAHLALDEASRTAGRVASFGSGTESGAGLSLLLADLRAALEHGDLVLHFQPQVEVASGRVTALEALVRWQHPAHGLVAPGAFIPLAERTGFISRITRYVVDEALTWCAAWRASGMCVAVAVNLSVQDLLDPGLVEHVRGALERHGLEGSALELEVTETDAMVDPERAVATMAALASLGVTLAIDDFGTGYSSLSYLGRLPAHRLKIDRGFVGDMRVDEASVAIVAATIDLGRRLGLRVVAEGVEDEETYRELAEMGCDCAQGFGLSRPVRGDAVPEVVSALESRIAHQSSGLSTG